MSILEVETETMINCPFCNSEAFYKFGKTKNENQRFRCLMCNRQFSQGGKKLEVQGKPICDKCNNPMHLYKIEGEVVRFRCSNYPKCKTFKKFKIQEEI